MRFILWALVLVMVVSCGGKGSAEVSETTDSTMHLSYAKGFRVAYKPGYKKLEVMRQSDGEVIERYYLVRDAAVEVPADGERITIPLRRIAVGSNTLFEMLSMMGCLESVVGVCSPQWVYNDTIRKWSAEGRLADLGDSFSLNLERLIYLRPDVLFVSGYSDGQQDGNKRVMQTGVTVVANREWQESSLLARAEWVKFMSLFFDKEQEAASLFDSIVARCNSLTDKVDSLQQRPNVMLGSGYKGTWYVPSGRSYMSELVALSGGAYAFANDTSYESLPLSFEQVMYRFSESDVWIGAPTNNYAQLVQMDERYAMFRPYKQKRVYSFAARTTQDGGNDFWESAVMRPDVVIADLITIFHPTLLPEHSLVYARALE